MGTTGDRKARLTLAAWSCRVEWRLQKAQHGQEPVQDAKPVGVGDGSGQERRDSTCPYYKRELLQHGHLEYCLHVRTTVSYS